MFPAKFQQMYIRLYWKGTKNDESNRKKIENSFSKIKGKCFVFKEGYLKINIIQILNLWFCV